MLNDVQAFEYLNSFQLRLHQVLQEVDDTLKQVGDQAYTAARPIYASASSQFAGPPLQLAADQLSKHFGRKVEVCDQPWRRRRQSSFPNTCFDTDFYQWSSCTAPPALFMTSLMRLETCFFEDGLCVG
jgi:hypothetical protein